VSNRKPIRWGESDSRRVYAVLGISALLIAFPFYWMVISTIRPEKEVYTVALNLLPSKLSFAMYRKLLGDPQLPVARFFLNSVVISIGATIANVINRGAGGLRLEPPPAARRDHLLLSDHRHHDGSGRVVLIGLFRWSMPWR